MCGKWIKDNSTALELAAAAAATAMTMGAASPLLIGAAGAEAAGAGAAGAAGAGAAGAGLLGGGAAAAGTAAADAAAAGLGGGTAALFAPTAGGSALAADAVIPSITSAGTAAGGGLGGGTSSLFGGTGLLSGAPETFTAGLGSGTGGASLPTFADKINSGLSNILPGGNDTLSSIKGGLGKLAKAQNALNTAKSSGLLGQTTQSAPVSNPFPQQQAAPTNFAQYKTQPNSMMPQSQLPPELAILPPNDPRVLAYLKQMQGGMYG